MTVSQAPSNTLALFDRWSKEPVRYFTNAQCFHPEKGLLYCTLNIPMIDGSSQSMIVRSDGQCLPYTVESIQREGIYPSASMVAPKTGELIPPSMLTRWSTLSLQAFLCDPTPQRTAAEVYQGVTAYLERFIYHNDARALHYLTLFTMGSYLHSLFEALPLLLITGESTTGKTRILEILSEVGFNGQLRGSLTAAALARRVTRDQPLLCLDEAEDLAHGQPRGEIFRLLRTMYRRSGNREVCGAAGTTAVADLFCPIIITNILGADDALRNRMIEIQSVPREGTLERFALHKQQIMMQHLRDDLYRFACTYAAKVYETYHTLPSVADMHDRDEEIWAPIFTLASVIDQTTATPTLLDEMVKFAGEIGTKQKEQKRFRARDVRIIAGLYYYLDEKEQLNAKEAEVNASELTTFIRTAETMPDLRPEEVSRVLKRAELITEQFRRRTSRNKSTTNPDKSTTNPDKSTTNPLVHYKLYVPRIKERAEKMEILKKSES
jgi:hypothetical protein